MANITGKTICVVGTPASGKSFLAKKLVKHYNCELVCEIPDPEKLPSQIKNNLSTQSNFFENQVWFRNHQIKRHNHTLNLSKKGTMVITDAPFYYNGLYNDYVLKSDFQKELFNEMIEHDLNTIEHTDITIYIENTQDSMKNFIYNRKGNWDWENDSWREFIVGIVPSANNFMDSIENRVPNLIKIKREDYDFKNHDNLKKLIKKIDEKLDSL